MAATIDNESLSGAWLREWLAQNHTHQEWRRHIQEQQDRIKFYIEQIDKLTKERDEMIRWQVDTCQTEMQLRAEIARLRKELGRD